MKQFGEIKLEQEVTTAPDIQFPSGALSPLGGGMRGTVVYVHYDWHRLALRAFVPPVLLAIAWLRL